MATISIQRKNDYINRTRDYGIYIDGLKIGTIANNETKDFQVEDGLHSMKAKIDWCYSSTLTFEIKGKQTINFQVGGFKNGRWLSPVFSGIILLHFILNLTLNIKWIIWLAFPFFFLLIYYLTIGKKDYLTLKELD